MKIKPYQLWNLLLFKGVDGRKIQKLVYILGFNSDGTIRVINLEPNSSNFGMLSNCNILENVDTRII